MEHWSNISEIFIENIRSTTLLEYLGVLFGLASVLYERKGSILVFPTGIVSVLIYFYICFNHRLYADMGINAYYFIMSVYGWYFWLRKDNSGHATLITTCSRNEIIKYLVITLMAFIILFLVLKNLTDSDVAAADALNTSIFITGMILLARKKLENWIAWIAGNFVSIPLYFYKGLVLTSLQFLIFFILSISGFIMWKKMMRQQTA
ncbi:MAG TPA: nicotinamide riboside transporter PnuC [Cyclobacteriaceae bacterium]|nr:nicotinamide riboside transporter PnuC [Cyclobacteriaceae bacterium]